MFHKAVDALHLVGYLDALRAMRFALMATDAMVRLTQTGHAPVVAYKKGTARLAVVFVLGRRRHVAFVDALVVVGEDAGDVDAVGAGHAILACGAGYGGIAQYHLRRIFQ